MFTNEDVSFLPTFNLDRVVPTLSDVVITPEMVLKKLRSIQAYRSPGPDGWPPRVIKECADVMCIPLAKLFTKSMSSGSLPKDWKAAHVVPIFKKGDRSTASYQLSTHQPHFYYWKGNDLMEHMSQCGLFSDSQHGFLPNKSCITQLLTTMNYWTESLNSGYPVDIIYFDFKKPLTRSLTAGYYLN